MSTSTGRSFPRPAVWTVPVAVIISILLYANYTSLTLAFGGLRKHAAPDDLIRYELGPASDDTRVSQLHPIDKLVSSARDKQEQVLARRTAGIEDAARTYRARRGRHPPPFFDIWVRAAEKKGAVMVEDLYDQIYDDLEPFWGVEASKVREDAMSWPYIITIRNGTVKKRSHVTPSIENWISRWARLIEQIPSLALPDVDLAFNPDDQPHIFVPWEEIQESLNVGRNTRHTKGPAELEIYTDLTRYDVVPEEPSFKSFPDAPSERNLWYLARDACDPDSSVHGTELDRDLTTPAQYSIGSLNHQDDTFVSNWTAAKSVCDNSHLRNVHGYFINSRNGSRANREENSIDRLTTRKLFPLLSPCKLQGVNNDILVPSALYYGNDHDHFFAVDNKTWSQKSDKVIWRGSSTGGFNNETNWTRFHRHRFVSMMNATQVDLTLQSSGIPAHLPGGDPPLPHNFPPPSLGLAAMKVPHEMGHWISSFANVSLVSLFCWPITTDVSDLDFCRYSSPFFKTAEVMEMGEVYIAKYLPDVDGDAYSGRFRSFMYSSSLPIKATIWSEWHDSRLIAWEHFVPMDSTYKDLYGLMEYFLGYQPSPGVDAPPAAKHDQTAEAIATQGRQWAKQVLRREDMVLYMWRLILEYARICDDRREQMGWINDLKG